MPDMRRVQRTPDTDRFQGLRETSPCANGSNGKPWRFRTGNWPAVLMLRQEYSDPKYAVSRPVVKTAAHNREETAASLTPREETVPFASQAAASRLMVF